MIPDSRSTATRSPLSFEIRGDGATPAAWTAVLETLARWPRPGVLAVERRIVRRGARLVDSVVLFDDTSGPLHRETAGAEELLAPVRSAVPLRPVKRSCPRPAAIATLHDVAPLSADAASSDALLDAVAEDLFRASAPAGVGITVWRDPWAGDVEDAEASAVLPLRCAIRVWSGEAVSAALLARVAGLAGAAGEGWRYPHGPEALERSKADLVAGRPPLTDPDFGVPTDDAGVRGFPVARIARLLADRWTGRGSSKVEWLGRPDQARHSNSGVPLGRVTTSSGRRRVMRLPWEQRALHTFICGGTGSGKSQLIARMASDDLAEGRAVVVLDPHGDLADLVLGTVPAQRSEEVVLIDPGNPHTAAIDVLAPTGDVARRVSALNDGLAQMAGDTIPFTRWRRRVSLALSALDELATVDTTVLAVNRFLSDDQVRIGIQIALGDTRIARRLAKSDRLFWDGALRSGPLASSAARGVFDHAPRYRLDDHLAGGHVAIARLGLGTLGTADASSIGTLFLARLLAAIASLEFRVDRQVSVYVDEAHLFAGSKMLGALLAQARKFGAAVTLATQTPSRLGGLLPEVLTNCGTTFAMRLPAREASAFAEAAGVHSVRMIGRLPRFHAVVLGQDHDVEREPVVLHPLPPLEPDLGRAEAVRRVAARHYGRPEDAGHRADLEPYARMADDAEDQLAERGHVSRSDYWRHRAELQRRREDAEPPKVWTPGDPDAAPSRAPILPRASAPRPRAVRQLVERSPTT